MEKPSASWLSSPTLLGGSSLKTLLLLDPNSAIHGIYLLALAKHLKRSHVHIFSPGFFNRLEVDGGFRVLADLCAAAGIEIVTESDLRENEYSETIAHCWSLGADPVSAFAIETQHISYYSDALRNYTDFSDSTLQSAHRIYTFAWSPIDVSSAFRQSAHSKKNEVIPFDLVRATWAEVERVTNIDLGKFMPPPGDVLVCMRYWGLTYFYQLTSRDSLLEILADTLSECSTSRVILKPDYRDPQDIEAFAAALRNKLTARGLAHSVAVWHERTEFQKLLGTLATVEFLMFRRFLGFRRIMAFDGTPMVTFGLTQPAPEFLWPSDETLDSNFIEDQALELVRTTIEIQKQIVLGFRDSGVIPDAVRYSNSSHHKIRNGGALLERARLGELTSRELHRLLTRTMETLEIRKAVNIEEFNRLVANIQATQSELAQNSLMLETGISNLVGERDALVGERDALVGERDALVGERDALVGERDALVGERDALVESLSWKITAGFRALASALLGLANFKK
jgi:hypothetical protein